MEMFVGYSARNMRVVQYCAKDLLFDFSFFFQRKRDRMTLSAIRPDGGENFRLCMILLQHYVFSFFFFFNFNKKWMIAGVQE